MNIKFNLSKFVTNSTMFVYICVCVCRNRHKNVRTRPTKIGLPRLRLFSAIFLSKFEKLSRINVWCAWNSNGFSCLPLSFYTEKNISLMFCLIFFIQLTHRQFWAYISGPFGIICFFTCGKKRMMMKRNYDIYCSNMPTNLAALFFPILILRTEWYRKHALQVHKAQTNNTLDPFPLILPMQHTWLHRTRYTWY